MKIKKILKWYISFINQKLPNDYVKFKRFNSLGINGLIWNAFFNLATGNISFSNAKTVLNWAKGDVLIFPYDTIGLKFQGKRQHTS